MLLSVGMDLRYWQRQWKRIWHIEIKCPALLMKDRAGSCIRYNKAWHKSTGIPIERIENAGHNSNTDAPSVVNDLIEHLILQL